MQLPSNQIHLSREPLSKLAKSFIETLREQLALQGFMPPGSPLSGKAIAGEKVEVLA